MKTMETKLIFLEDLYLDPNNYRLRSHPKYVYVDENSIKSIAIQKRTQNLLSGKKSILIKELIDSMKSNGYLKVDNILVREIGKTGKFVVIEGNRRLCTLKYLYDEYKQSYSIGLLNEDLFKKPENNKSYGLEVVIIPKQHEKDYLILMGLKHVSGNKKWDSYNQSKLIYELHKKQEYSPLDIARSIGISTSQVTLNIKSYFAIEEFITYIKDENYGDEFNPFDKFMMFKTLMTKPILREWLEWKDDDSKFHNDLNKTRFFSWLVPTIEIDDETEEEILLDPIILNHKQIRDLPEMIDDEDALVSMEETRNFDLAMDRSSLVLKKQFTRTLINIEKSLKSIKVGSFLNICTEDEEKIHVIIELSKKLLSFKDNENS